MSKVPFYIYKISRALYLLKLTILANVLVVVNRIIFGLYVPPQAILGKNVRFGYGGSGIVIHKNCVIGDNVIISPGVVLGGRGGVAVPIIGSGVFIGPNAVLLGETIVGSNVVIGANSLIIDAFIEDDSTVLSNKSKIWKK